MRDRRVLLPLLLLVGLTLTGCGLTAGGAGGRAADTAASSEHDRAGAVDGKPVRPVLGEGRGIATGAARQPDDPSPLPIPLPLALALAAGAVVAAGAAAYLWWQRRGTAAAAAGWQGSPGAAGPAGPPVSPLVPGAAASHAPPPGESFAGASGGAPPPYPPQPAAPTAPYAVPSGPPGSSGSQQAPSAPSGVPGPSASPGGGQVPLQGDPLADALAEVAGSGISQALTQQVERLFAGGHPGRGALVEACIGYRDQIAERHPRLADTLMEGLSRAGVQEIVADGRRFDPRLHEAFGTEPTGRPELHDIVAETVKRGYADGDRVIRVPQVAVYRHEAPGSETAQ
ncbi:nucleotide exchange factor GrpE [Streptosporangium sp. NPDC051022]|uniref:nucleotide exchange factor GrpE n=1 Tax=Streptosporangium sp. NPDC051022 TaxID=3155752 RepID=UPI00341D6BE3